MVRNLFLVPDVPPQSEIMDGVEGLAWEHATLHADLSGIELGSDHFLNMHRSLLERYRECGDHLGFVQHTAMRMLQQLLVSNKMALVIPKNVSSSELSNILAYLGHITTSCVMWVHAAYPEQWIDNETWNELDEDYRGVDFPIEVPNEEETNDNDY